jgi:hypothetical protein
MNYGPNNIGDLSNNMYAAIMRYLAEGLSGWSIFVLVPFLMSQIVTNSSASLISLKAVMVIIVGVTIFAIAAWLANVLVAAVLATLVTPFAMKGETELVQNIQNTILAMFGLSLCVAAWFFAKSVVDYMYS